MINTCTLIIGLGNPILGDDGVGWRVAELVRQTLTSQESSERVEKVEVDCLAIGGLGLMEHLAGYDRAILIDAITTGKYPPGTVSCMELHTLPDQAIGHMSSPHDTSLLTALEMGRKLGVHLPEQITIVAIEAQNLFEFSEDLSPAVGEAVPQAARTVLDLIQRGPITSYYLKKDT